METIELIILLSILGLISLKKISKALLLYLTNNAAQMETPSEPDSNATPQFPDVDTDDKSEA